MSEKKRFLKSVLGVNLFYELLVDQLVGDVWVRLVRHAHWSVLEHGYVGSKIPDELRRKFTFLGYRGGKLARVVLDVLYRGSGEY